MKPYIASNWYWAVGTDTSKVYSSAAGDYVPSNDATYQAWREDGTKPTPTGTEAELADVLASASVRPVNANILDGYRGNQASNLHWRSQRRSPQS